MVQRAVLEGLMRDGAIRRSRDLAKKGVAAATVQRALADGWLEKVSRGTYRKAGANHEEGEHLAEVMARVSEGVVCLHSAAALHGLGDLEPRDVWIGIPHAAKPTALHNRGVRFVRWRRTEAFREGVSERRVCGIQVKVTGPARTVVDLLTLKGGSGWDVGLRCLGDYFRNGGSSAELRSSARAMGAADRLANTFDVAEAMAVGS